jgi:hypothetical protein
VYTRAVQGSDFEHGRGCVVRFLHKRATKRHRNVILTASGGRQWSEHQMLRTKGYLTEWPALSSPLQVLRDYRSTARSISCRTFHEDLQPVSSIYPRASGDAVTVAAGSGSMGASYADTTPDQSFRAHTPSPPAVRKSLKAFISSPTKTITWSWEKFSNQQTNPDEKKRVFRRYRRS